MSKVILTDKEKEYLLRWSPKSLPDNPTARGYNAAQIKKYQYYGFEILFNWLQEISDYDYATQDSHNNRISALENDNHIHKGDYLGDVSTGDLIYAGTRYGNNIDYFDNNQVVSLWTIDSQDNVLPAVFPSIAEQVYFVEEEKTLDEVVENLRTTDTNNFNTLNTKIDNNQATARQELASAVSDLTTQISANSVADKGYTDQEVNKIKNGTYIADKARKDTNGETLLARNYANNLNIYYTASTGGLSIVLKDQSGRTLAAKSVDLPTENIVQSFSYDATTKELVFTLYSGGTTRIPIGDLVDTYLVADTNTIDMSLDSTTNTITAELKDGSVQLGHLSPTFQSQWNSWASEEADRVTAEQGRVAAESGRVTAENSRVIAENARVLAEQNRESAETRRDQEVADAIAEMKALPHLFIDSEGFLSINYGSTDVVID